MRSLSPSRVPSVLRVAAPLAVVAVLAAACGSGTSAPAPSPSGATSPATAALAAPGGTVKIETHSGPDGSYLTDGSGRTLYLWTADTGTTSTCTGGCAAAWPPVTSSSTPSAGSGVSASQLGLSKRSDGTEQVTYDGHPLYYFADDTSPGQMNGQGSTGFGAAWWIVSPSGSAITAAAASGSSDGPSGNASSSGSGSGSSWG
jgi:predicted lipoprotein with Yx(FWY)xxD motif